MCDSRNFAGREGMLSRKLPLSSVVTPVFEFFITTDTFDIGAFFSSVILPLMTRSIGCEYDIDDIILISAENKIGRFMSEDFGPPAGGMVK